MESFHTQMFSRKSSKKAPDSPLASLHEQWVHKVTDFSSQYGSENRGSYTAANLAGPPAMYPRYGDFNEACVLRTYGPWWQPQPLNKGFPGCSRRHKNGFISADYVDCKFEKEVYPCKVSIYETYNPGALVRILAGRRDNSDKHSIDLWFELWKGDASLLPEKTARIFSPALCVCPFKTRLIRLEFCSDFLNYYTELDAVLLVSREDGKKPSLEMGVESQSAKAGEATQSLQCELGRLTLTGDGRGDGPALSFGVADLPDEVIIYIFKLLDLKSLLSVGQACKKLATLASDSQLYKYLDLQPHWHLINKTALQCLRLRLANLVILDISWCGSYKRISEANFKQFVTGLSKLRVLKAYSCSFMTTNCLRYVATHCRKLQDLNVGSCTNIQVFDAIASLPLLICLNLYRTSVTDESLTLIARACPDLEELNIGSCVAIASPNITMATVGEYCHRLRVLDLWRMRGLTLEGLEGLLANNDGRVEELDLGWCDNLATSPQLNGLLSKCGALRKIFFTANRKITDDLLAALANCCSDLEQLDLLGNNQVTLEGVEQILKKCPKMAFLDVSFCSNIGCLDVHIWENKFQKCNFKKSYTGS